MILGFKKIEKMAIQAQLYPENLGLPLGGSQDWLMDNNNNNNNNLFFNGCGFNDFSFNLQPQQYLVHLQNQNHSIPCENGFVFLPSSKNLNNNATPTTASTITTESSDHIPLNLSHTMAAQLDKHGHEIDRYITLQNERLKVVLQEQRKHQLATILKKLEAKAMMMLKQKDEEIAKATNRRIELEEFMRKMEVENQAWQRVAAENETMVVTLNNTLEQLKEQVACFFNSSNGVDDAESCCDDNEYPCRNRGNEEQETGETGKGEKEGERKKGKMVCRVCNSRNASVILLPCRHLCSCKDCEAFLDSCPLCFSLKKASLEAFFS